MASSSGSSPGFLRPSFDWLRRCAGALALCLCTAQTLAEQPAYLRTALDKFTPGVPAGWAYTLTTVRNERAITERFDPTRPPGGQWMLLEIEGRLPTAEESEKYLRARTAGPGGMQANFEKADIEPGSLSLVQEDATQAEFAGGFRETSTGTDKMLGHLNLRLKVDKQAAYVTAYTLELREPYSPVLGVKMTDLQVEARFSAPEGSRPSLLQTMTSRFTGRIFFISTGENLQLNYRDHTAATGLSR